ncbi:MAG: superoxide dismutase family protein [Cytophagales bacterium]|nr:MAG: superoxide dismutase family protein [Cytophagales bacterium]
MQSFFKTGSGLTLLALALLTSCADHNNGSLTITTAAANIINTSGTTIGTARLSQTGDQPVSMTLTVSGLPPGPHGIHFHEVGMADPRTSPPFQSAGEHYNPTSHQHGLENPNGAHGGDLPNLIVDAVGSATYITSTDRVTLIDGPRTLFDANGSSLIIHTNADDQRTDPSGNSGGRIAGGVVVRP